ncbi:uncharacterized protein RMCC_2232 [Mycolicibacterium canariasense]|uniref:DUF5642 domain-containing protein n=1 Tax=Mycolicibacterium canariasense TaxID=228230 RepID=A0A100WC20_MYCCR|nr:hypothetical protein [Mycolicibacterium canariasense]MCV7209208.1 hypothetical protein [Mycolicibacterium canariasense]ORV05949.1 hypothetical protein AWB94_18790 [Mycolicibacterium canariasense]GAS95266.1 uncharacterized protein RMCC_2232 [Mycolicibacterium canariasense]
MTARLVGAALTAVAVAGCGEVVTGTATWPGARLQNVVLTAPDFPAGVRYDRIVEQPGVPDGAGAPPAMLSTPEGCSDGFTRVIAASAERGPGSAAKYSVSYDGARMVVTVSSWQLDLDAITATAHRCARYETFFDRSMPGIPMTTTRLSTDRPGALVYEQTMQLGSERSSVYSSFENVDGMAVFAVAFPTPDPTVPVRATLPQTFTEVVGKQAHRLAQR